MRKLIIFLLLAVSLKNAMAQNDTTTTTDALSLRTSELVDAAYRKMKELNNIDTLYIEPQHYSFTAMLQNTNTYDIYRIRSKEGASLLFAPEPTIKIGPYFGWKWIFAGYTFDINRLNRKRKQEFDLSIYTSKIGFDLFWRTSKKDYKIRDIDFGKDVNTANMKNISFNGLNVGIKGFNAYYIFNHRKFSYPAAFSQSTRQKRSAGSVLMGIGYTRHTLEFDYEKFLNIVHMNIPNYNQELDSGLMFKIIKFSDLSISGGYAYNYVFATNWLLAVSLSAALGYKKSSGDLQHKEFIFQDFRFSNISIDGVARLGIVFNNDKWFTGANAILHSYNYSKPQFSTNNFFGSFNIYIGFNFNFNKKHETPF